MLNILRFERQFSKRTKRWYPVKVLEPKNYAYIPALMKMVFMQKGRSNTPVSARVGMSSDDPRQIAPNISAVPPPSVQVLVDSHTSRFVNLSNMYFKLLWVDGAH